MNRDTTESDLALKPGDRVKLCKGIEGPPNRKGVVVENRPKQNGCLILHDHPTNEVYGWAYSEFQMCMSWHSAKHWRRRAEKWLEEKQKADMALQPKTGRLP